MFPRSKSRCWPVGCYQKTPGSNPFQTHPGCRQNSASCRLGLQPSLFCWLSEDWPSHLACRSFSLGLACGPCSLKSAKSMLNPSHIWILFWFLSLPPIASASCAACFFCFQPEKVVCFKDSSDYIGATWINQDHLIILWSTISSHLQSPIWHVI